MKKLYLFILTLFVAIAANAVTLTGSVSKYSYSGGNTVASETPATAEVTIADGVVSFSKLCGADFSLDVTCYSNKTVSYSVSTNYVSGDFTFGDFTSAGLYFYDSNDDFKYYVEDGKQILYLGVWETEDNKSYDGWLDVYFELPDDFVPVEYVAPEYFGQPYTVKATISDYYETYFKTETVDMTIYVDGNVITIPNYLGGEEAVTYTLSDDGTSVSGGVPNDYLYIDWTVGETNFYATYGYAGQAEINEPRTLRDAFYVYKSQSECTWVNVYIELPTFVDATATLNGESSTFKVAYTYDGNGVITFPQFFATSIDAAFTIMETEKVSNNISSNYYNCTLGELGVKNIYLSNDSYTTQKYAKTDDAQTLTLSFYGGTTVVITLPADFEPQELEKNVKLYAFDGEKESGEAIPAHLDYTISGSTVTITNPFDKSKLSLAYTMQTDGTIYSTMSTGYYTGSCSFNGVTYARLFDNARAYDVENNEFVWTIGFTADSNVKEFASAEAKYVLHLPLPEDFEASEPIIMEDLKSVIYTQTPAGTYLPAVTSTETVNTTNKASNSVVLTKAFTKSVSVTLSWDESGAVTVDGTFPSQWYVISGEYYKSINIDASKSKYVKDEEDEYLELSLTTDKGYYGGDAYTDALYRIYFVKNSADVKTITVSAYEYDFETGEYGDGESSSLHTYAVENGAVAIDSLLYSDINLSVSFLSAAEGETEGSAQTNLAAGTYEGTFYALGKTYSTLVYDGDEEAAGWYSSGRSKYAYIDVTLDGEEVELEFAIPSGVKYLDGINIDVLNWETGAYGKTITAQGYVEDGTVVIPNFAGSNKALTVTVYEDNAIELTFDGQTYTKTGYYYKTADGDNVTGNFDLGTYQLSQIQVSRLDYFLDGENDGAYNIEIGGWAVPADGSDKFNASIYIVLPDGFTPKEYEKNVEVHNVVDGVESAEGNKVHWDVTISGSTVTINSPFDAARTLTFPFTMQTDGSVYCTFDAGGYFTTTFTYDSFNYARLKDYKREYIAETQQFKWTVGLCQLNENKEEYDEDSFVVYVQLPDDFEASKPIEIKDLTTEVITNRNGIEFVNKVSKTTTNVTDLDEGSISVSKLMGNTVTLPISWNEAGEITTNEKVSGSYYFNIGDDYYQGFVVDAANSKYVKGDEDEYVELAGSFNQGYYVDDLNNVKVRIYIEKNSETVVGNTITLYVSEYDGDDEVNYVSLPHYYTVEENVVTISNFLDGTDDLVLTYYNDGIVKTNWKVGDNAGTYYVFNEQFSSFNYDGDIDSAGWDEEDGETYTWLVITLGDGREVEITLYNPRELSYASGIADVNADANDGDVEYFNLQGIRVVNPANGIYIRRQGNNVSKVLVK
jgi:hypothetical protein